MNKIIKELKEALNTNTETKAYDTQAEVVRVEGQTLWVHIPGGVDETPVKKTINAKAGDTVQVRVGGGSAWLVGNQSAPPTDDTTAIIADRRASEVRGIALEAQQSAEMAELKADDAYDLATTAKTSADGKNTIYYGASEPTGGTYKTGDTWFNSSEDNAIYMWNGSAWVKEELGEDAIENLSITNAKIANGTIQNGKIANLDAGKITSGDIDANRIKTNVVSAINATANKINAQNINVDGTLIVGASDVDNAIDGIEVGGVNFYGYGSDMQTSLSGLNNYNNGFSIVTEDGIKCAHATGALNTTKYLQSKLTFTPKPMETWTFSVDVKIKNIVRGTTNPVCEFYFGGATIDGSWRGWSVVSWKLDGTEIVGTTTYKGIGFDRQIADTNWHHVEVTAYFNYNGTSTIPAMLPIVYLRDVTGDIYIHHVKLERGNKATDWTPSLEDVDKSIEKSVSGATNILFDTNVPSLTRINANHDRYFSDTGYSSYITCSIVKLSDPPEAGIQYAYRAVCNGTNTAAAARALVFYDAANTTEIPLKVGTMYTVSFWGRCTNGTAQTYANYRYKGTSNRSVQFDDNSFPTLTSEWKLYTGTIQLESMPTDYNRVWFYIRFLANTAGTAELCGFKITSGASVSTYITKIDNGGIKVHDAGDTSNYSQINSNGMEVVKGGVSTAKFGEETRVGKKANFNTVLNSERAKFKSGSNGAEIGFSPHWDTSQKTFIYNMGGSDHVSASFTAPLDVTNVTINIRRPDYYGGGIGFTKTLSASGYSETGTNFWGDEDDYYIRRLSDTDFETGANDENEYTGYYTTEVIYTSGSLYKYSTSQNNRLSYDEMGYYMHSGQTVWLNDSVSNQFSGIVLCWSAYVNGTPQNYNWHYQFVPKEQVIEHAGVGTNTIMATPDFNKVGTKYVYVYDNRIVGNDNNSSTGTASGITFANNYWVLRYVIGV